MRSRFTSKTRTVTTRSHGASTTSAKRKVTTKRPSRCKVARPPTRSNGSMASATRSAKKSANFTICGRTSSNKHDVYLGAGSDLNRKRKGTLYRKLLIDNCQEYEHTDKHNKREFAMQKIIREIQRKRGRFFILSKANGRFEEANPSIVLKTVMQALRDEKKRTKAESINHKSDEADPPPLQKQQQGQARVDSSLHNPHVQPNPDDKVVMEEDDDNDEEDEYEYIYDDPQGGEEQQYQESLFSSPRRMNVNAQRNNLDGDVVNADEDLSPFDLFHDSSSRLGETNLSLEDSPEAVSIIMNMNKNNAFSGLCSSVTSSTATATSSNTATSPSTFSRTTASFAAAPAAPTLPSETVQLCKPLKNQQNRRNRGDIIDTTRSGAVSGRSNRLRLLRLAQGEQFDPEIHLIEDDLFAFFADETCAYIESGSEEPSLQDGVNLVAPELNFVYQDEERLHDGRADHHEPDGGNNIFNGVHMLQEEVQQQQQRDYFEQEAIIRNNHEQVFLWDHLQMAPPQQQLVLESARVTPPRRGSGPAENMAGGGSMMLQDASSSHHFNFNMIEQNIAARLIQLEELVRNLESEMGETSSALVRAHQNHQEQPQEGSLGG